MYARTNSQAGLCTHVRHRSCQNRKKVIGFHNTSRRISLPIRVRVHAMMASRRSPAYRHTHPQRYEERKYLRDSHYTIVLPSVSSLDRTKSMVSQRHTRTANTNRSGDRASVEPNQSHSHSFRCGSWVKGKEKTKRSLRPQRTFHKCIPNTHH